MDYERGPCELIRPDQVPRLRPFEATFTNIAAPVSAQLDTGEQLTAAIGGEVAALPADNLDGAFDEIIGPAIGEINAQLQSLSDVDLGPAIAGVEESFNEIPGLAYEVQPSGLQQLPAVNVEGIDPFQDTAWGGGGIPPEPGPGPPEPPAPPTTEPPPPVRDRYTRDDAIAAIAAWGRATFGRDIPQDVWNELQATFPPAQALFTEAELTRAKDIVRSRFPF